MQPAPGSIPSGGHADPSANPPESLDIVIPTYNAPPGRLAQTIRSALDCPSLRDVIVVDDGSPRLVESGWLARISSKARLIRQENAGPAAARNTGIAAGTGAAVCFIDDDDTLIPSGIFAAVHTMARLGTAGVVSARIHTRSPNHTEHKSVPPEWADQKLPHPSHVLRPIGLFGASGSIVSRAALDAGIRFNTSLKLGEDRDFLHKVASFGGLAINSHPALWVAIHDNATNLTSPAHYARRINDHIVMLNRYTDPIATEHLREATRWLINNAAKTGVDAHSWRILLDAARAHGISLPMKARLRRMLHR
ncbi:MAG: glycosyltransferase family 2 protein [Phycisphaerales bacterium]|nr:glycosyltransferase family 2 protein [Phycisphaerales bacterium]